MEEPGSSGTRWAAPVRKDLLLPALTQRNCNCLRRHSASPAEATGLRIAAAFPTVGPQAQPRLEARDPRLSPVKGLSARHTVYGQEQVAPPPRHGAAHSSPAPQTSVPPPPAPGKGHSATAEHFSPPTPFRELSHKGIWRPCEARRSHTSNRSCRSPLAELPSSALPRALSVYPPPRERALTLPGGALSPPTAPPPALGRARAWGPPHPLLPLLTP